MTTDDTRDIVARIDAALAQAEATHVDECPLCGGTGEISTSLTGSRYLEDVPCPECGIDRNEGLLREARDEIAALRKRNAALEAMGKDAFILASTIVQGDVVSARGVAISIANRITSGLGASILKRLLKGDNNER